MPEATVPGMSRAGWLAARRNAASLGGNVCTASPISDLNPLLIAAGAEFEVAGAGVGQRRVAAAKFFLGYRRVDLQPHEVLVRVRLASLPTYCHRLHTLAGPGLDRSRASASAEARRRGSGRTGT